MKEAILNWRDSLFIELSLYLDEVVDRRRQKKRHEWQNIDDNFRKIWEGCSGLANIIIDDKLKLRYTQPEDMFAEYHICNSGCKHGAGDGTYICHQPCREDSNDPYFWDDPDQVKDCYVSNIKN